MLRVAIALLLLGGCRKATTRGELPADAGAAPSPPIAVTGIARSAELEPIAAGNLTRAEAQVIALVERSGVDVSEACWISVFATGESVPTATGRGGELLAVAPGRYTLGIALREAPAATGSATVGPIELAPATRSRLAVHVTFATGPLTVKATNRGRSVDAETEVAVRAQPGEAPAATALGGEAIVLPAGPWHVDVTWRVPDGAPQTYATQADITGARGATVAHDFDLSLGRIEVQVTEGGRDVSDAATVTVREGSRVLVDRGSAGQAWTVPAGTYDIDVTWDDGPLVRARRLLRAQTISEGQGAIDVALDVAAGTVTFRAVGGSQPIDGDCSVRLKSGKASAEVAAGTPVRVPAGTWDAEVRCGERVRKITSLVVAAGAHQERRVHF